MSKKKESSAVEPSQPTLSPKQIVMRVLGVGEAAAEGVLKRMADKASELPAKYNSGQARDWITEHNVKPPAVSVETPPVFEDELAVEPISEQESTETL